MAVVAFATYRDAPDLAADDCLAAEALRRLGVAVEPAIWNDPAVDWARFDRVVVRSTWDYHLEPARYADWLETFRPRPGRLWNPVDLIRDTLDKRYLVTLAARGVPVVPTAVRAAGDGDSLAALIEERGWDEIVVKPAVSASARGTWRSSRAAAAADAARFSAQAREQDLLVQPYCPEVAERGEWSLIFLGGAYSHAVLKQPAAGDFRVQRHHGGAAIAATPPPALVDQAAAVLGALGGPALYARVDGIERDGVFLLMEAEVNEPFLFLWASDAAPARFAGAINRILGR